MSVSIRTVEPDEIEPWVEAQRLGFLQEPAAPGEAEARAASFDLTRTLGAYDAEERGFVGTFRSFATRFSVPGERDLPASAITSVTVRATHRRRGLLRSMMNVDLEASLQRGEPVAILIASEFPIYGRYGFGPAMDHAGYEIDAGMTRFRTETPGSVSIVSNETLRGEVEAIYERFRLSQPGSITRRPNHWDVSLGLRELPGRPRWKGRCALYRDAAGQAAGYLRYHVDESWDQRVSRTKLIVDELVATTVEAYARLWRLCVEMDWVTQVKAEDRSVDELLPWLLVDARAVRLVQRADLVWVRLLDVPAALAARTYPEPGRVVIEVVDELGFGAGCWSLEVDESGTARCREAAPSEAGLRLPISTLGAAYVGGVGLRRLAEAGLLDVHAAEALTRADAMFRSPVTPWCNTWF